MSTGFFVLIAHYYVTVDLFILECVRSWVRTSVGSSQRL